MNVAELKKMLDNYPDDMPVIKEIYSDYQGVEEVDFSIEKAVYREGMGYYMRPHRTMSNENKEHVYACLCIAGN